MYDTVMVLLRYTLIALGTSLATKGYVSQDQINTVTSALPSIVGGIGAVASAAWGVWVRYNTRAVPAKTAARSDVPTVDPVTGKTVPGSEG